MSFISFRFYYAIKLKLTLSEKQYVEGKKKKSLKIELMEFLFRDLLRVRKRENWLERGLTAKNGARRETCIVALHVVFTFTEAHGYGAWGAHL